jgi:hypothetical protein
VPELKKAIVGKTITDGTHWSDRFKPDGTVESVMHGQVLGGRWRVRGGELCIADSNGKGKPQAEDCFGKSGAMATQSNIGAMETALRRGLVNR